MGKRKRAKRVFPRKYASDFINVMQGPNPDKVAEYQRAVRTTSGPKNNALPVLEHSFTKPIDNGVPGSFKCSECGRRFETTISWTAHLRKFRASEAEKHEPIFKPDRKVGHEDIETEKYVYHSRIPQPRREAQTQYRLWQDRRRQGFDTWHWHVQNRAKDYVLYLGFSGLGWKFKREYTDGRAQETLTYASKEQIMSTFEALKLSWKPITNKLA